MITIHYHRFDGDYEGVSLWTWDRDLRRNPMEQDLLPAGWDDYGPFFRIDPELYGEDPNRHVIGFIPRLRRDWAHKDGGDRFWRENLGNTVWLVGGDPTIYRERPDTSPKVQNAWVDGEQLITVVLSHGMELGRLTPERFHLRSAGGHTLHVASIRALDARMGKARTLELSLEAPVDPEHKMVVLVEGYRPAEAVLRQYLCDSTAYFDEGPLGALYTPERTTFRLFAPTATAVEVILYDHPTGPEGRTVLPLRRTARGMWEATAPGDLEGRHYMVWADCEGPQARMEVVDIHSRCNTGHDGRGRITDLRRLDPPGFRPVRRPKNIDHPTDAVIWEVHLRDFTVHESSGVAPELRGKYLGAAQRGTLLPGTELKTGIDHLVELGVTHVQLLPVHDFDNNEGRPDYNWGYMTTNFNSPEGWFASNYRDASRVAEFKQLVQAFHEAGIRVVMDVVYNHTAPTATFESLVPGYYLRRREDGTLWNGSGCGNEFRSESPMGRKFIVDSCRYWVEEFGVDGFRFDLMGLIDLETMRRVRDELHAIDPTLLVYGEPWAAAGQEDVGLRPITYKNVVSGTGIGAFNDHFRNAIKGAPDGPEPGYVQTGCGRDAIRKGVQGSIHDWAQQPGEAIQYATCHDNLTLWDKLDLSCPEETEEERLKMQMMVAGILATSQGVMFLHGGLELARTKFGHHNSYNAPDAINQIDWERKERFGAVFNYVKGMVELRRAHPLFRLRTREHVETRLFFRDDLCPETQSCLAFQINGRDLPGESWQEALVFYNPTQADLSFRLPAGSWSLFAQGENVGTAPLLEVEGSVAVFSRSVAIVARVQAW